MSSGRHTLRNLDRSLRTAREELNRVDQTTQEVTVAFASLRQREAGLYTKLAKLRVKDLDTEAFETALDAADKRASELMREREQVLSEIINESRLVQQRQTHLEDLREKQIEGVEQAELAHERLVSDVHAKLALDIAYTKQQARAQQAVDTAERAQQKTDQAEDDQKEKGKPYESDPLFMYLWDRGYGISRYKAGPIARFVDNKLARHISFESARRNYYLLNEIPRRLKAHTTALYEQADAEMHSLAEQERDAEIAAGIEAAESTLAEKTQTLRKTDVDIEQVEKEFSDLMRRREAFASGDDPYFLEAIKVLVDNFRSEPVAQLRHESRLTPAPIDDELVYELADVRAEKERIEQSMEDTKRLHHRHLERLQELEEVRRRFKRKDFDSANSIFSESGNVEMMLGQFLRGLITADNLWRVIRHSQSFGRGAGPLGGSYRSGRRPSRAGFPRGIRLPRSSGRSRRSSSGGRRSSGGGFRTGGGF